MAASELRVEREDGMVLAASRTLPERIAKMGRPAHVDPPPDG
jgi:hypothetical protein